MNQVSGVLRSGHQVASGMAVDSPYEKGTIEMQSPYFKALGLDLSPFFYGTLNIDIAPHRFKVLQPQYTFRHVKWHPDYPAEDFSFSPCEVTFQNKIYQSLVYYPHPETKIGHFQEPTTIEIMAAKIPDLEYESNLAIAFKPSEIAIL